MSITKVSKKTRDEFTARVAYWSHQMMEHGDTDVASLLQRAELQKRTSARRKNTHGGWKVRLAANNQLIVLDKDILSRVVVEQTNV